MSRPSGDGLARVHLKRLVFMIAGSAIFTSFLFCLQTFLAFVGHPPDPSVYNFYPIMAGLGAVFGFERWWANEYGDVNPFHDKQA